MRIECKCESDRLASFFSGGEILVLANRGQCSLSLVWGRGVEWGGGKGMEVVGGLCNCGAGVNIPQKA